MNDVSSIPGFDSDAANAARRRQSELTKPPGSLGRLEDLAIWFAGARGQFPVPVPQRCELFVFAADHGVVDEGVSAYPAAVTRAMVDNFRRGGAAVSVLARHANVAMTVVDAGIAPGAEPFAASVPSHFPVGFLSAPVRAGTANFVKSAAMSTEEAQGALALGASCAEAASGRGAELLLGGDMGIGNTTSAAALLCAFGGDDPAEAVGLGTGIDEVTRARKIAVVRAALDLHRPNPSRPLDVLAALGGLEIAALAGLMIEGARRRIPTVVDGFIAGAAALVAVHLAPGVRSYLLLSHVSAERGARRLCSLLGGPAPLLDLGMRLGEGTGAVLAVPLLRSAVAAQNEMASFVEAAVPNRA